MFLLGNNEIKDDFEHNLSVPCILYDYTEFSFKEYKINQSF